MGASAGRNHTSVFTANGESFSFGLNNYGQLGTGNVKKSKGAEDMALTPQLVRGRKLGPTNRGGGKQEWARLAGRVDGWTCGQARQGLGARGRYMAAGRISDACCSPQQALGVPQQWLEQQPQRGAVAAACLVACMAGWLRSLMACAHPPSPLFLPPAVPGVQVQ